MKTKMLALLLAATAGCSHTPLSMMDEEPRTSFTSEKGASDTAACIARNADELRHGVLGLNYTANVRATTEGAFQIVYGGQGWLIFVAKATPADKGSHIDFWRTEAPVLTLGPGDLGEQVMRGCAIVSKK